MFVLSGLAYVGAQIDQAITKLKTQSSELYTHPFQVNASAREARLAAYKIRNELLYAIADDTKIHSGIVEHIHEFDALLERNLLTIEANFLGDMTQIGAALELTNRWRNERIQLVALLSKGRNAEAEEFMLTRTSSIYEALISKLDYVVDFSAQKAKYFADQAEQESALFLVHFHLLIFALMLIIMMVGGITVVVVLSGLRHRDKQLAKQHKAMRRFESIVKSSDDAIISKTLDGIIESWNDSAEKIFGYSAEEAIGRSMQMLIPSDRLNEEPEIMARIARGERIDHFETVRCRKDRSLINISATISPIIDDAGKVIGASTIARDFTEHHRIELELSIAAAAFEAQEGIVVTDPQDVVVRVNKAFTKITGYQTDDAVGRKMNLIKSGHHDESFYESMWTRLIHCGEWQGEIWNRCKNGEIHPHWVTITSVKDNNENVTNYVGTYMDITDRKRNEEEVKQLAFHDSLTKLPNRRLLNDRLQQAMVASNRSQSYGALMFVDMDNFKPLNDMHGHETGDLLLIEVANRLRSCVREMDVVARIGGDEFVVMVNELDTDKVDSTALAEGIAEKIRVSLSTPYHFEIERYDEVITIEYYCTASIGVIMFVGKQYGQDNLLKWADNAMYQAKKGGRNLIRFYTPTL